MKPNRKQSGATNGHRPVVAKLPGARTVVPTTEPKLRDFKLEFAQWQEVSQQYLAGKGKR